MDLKEKNKIIHEFMNKEWSNKKKFQLDYLNTYPSILWEVIEEIVKFKYDDGDTAYFRTFGMIDKETGMYMVRINRKALFQANTLKEATFNAIVDFCYLHKDNK